MNTFVHHFDILPIPQKSIWKSLSPCKDLGFVLYGGTAISLHFGHRTSVDFDFFSDIELDGKQEKRLLSALQFLGESEMTQQELNTCSFLTQEGVRISFFGGMKFGRVDEPLLTNDKVLQVASLYDLFGTKLKVLLQRIEVKDYKDISVLLGNGLSLEKGLACSTALYGKQFPASESVKALTYFHGGNLDSLTEKERDILISAASNTHIYQLPKVEILSYSLGISRNT